MTRFPSLCEAAGGHQVRHTAAGGFSFRGVAALALLLFAGVSFAEPPPHKASDWRLAGDPPAKQPGAGVATESDEIPANSVIDLEPFGAYLWVATGAGIGRLTPTPTPDGYTEWQAYSHGESGIGRGGVSAITGTQASWGALVVWAATAFDSTVSSGETLPAGGGVGFSTDLGETWMWIPQPVDSLDDPGIEPTVTPVQNVTYDIGVLGDRVWITSWGGGIRYFDMYEGMENDDPAGLEWVNRPPDTVAFDVRDNNNHRGFSVAVDDADSLLWVGTAAGINLSRDNGDTWENFRFSSENPNTPNGDFVPALSVQKTSSGRSILWAGCWVVSAEAGQFYGISKTETEGATWERVLGSPEQPVRVHNFAFQDSIVYAASEFGLYKSADYGETWALFPNPRDAATGVRFYEDEVFCAAHGFDILWVGGPEGLGISDDGGNSWEIARTAPDPDASATYAYPNPFSPDRYEVVRMRYSLAEADAVTVEIYDFALELLIRPVKDHYRPAGEHDEVWDGYGPAGESIANGVYFYRITGGGEERWGKILVID